jgi:hypothetical protein
MQGTANRDRFATELHLASVVTRAFRPLIAFALSLLLVGMQVGAQLHALEHDGERLARPHGAGVLVPGADDVCAVCASFAGGSHAIPTSIHTIGVPPPRAARPTGGFASIAGAPPAYYQTRAPPTLL